MATATLKKVSFANIAKREDKPKSNHPPLPDSPEVRELVDRIVADSENLTQVEARLAVYKAELKIRCTPFYFESNSGRVDVPTSIVAHGDDGEVMVVYQNRYGKLLDESSVQSVLGRNTAKHFRQSFKVEVNGDKLPADKSQELLDRMSELFIEYGCVDALSVKETIKPNDQFHAVRHTALSVEENIMVDMACPIIVQIKPKKTK